MWNWFSLDTKLIFSITSEFSPYFADLFAVLFLVAFLSGCIRLHWYNVYMHLLCLFRCHLQCSTKFDNLGKTLMLSYCTKSLDKISIRTRFKSSTNIELLFFSIRREHNLIIVFQNWSSWIDVIVWPSRHIILPLENFPIRSNYSVYSWNRPIKSHTAIPQYLEQNSILSSVDGWI